MWELGELARQHAVRLIYRNNHHNYRFGAHCADDRIEKLLEGTGLHSYLQYTCTIGAYIQYSIVQYRIYLNIIVQGAGGRYSITERFSKTYGGSKPLTASTLIAAQSRPSRIILNWYEDQIILLLFNFVMLLAILHITVLINAMLLMVFRSKRKPSYTSYMVPFTAVYIGPTQGRWSNSLLSRC